MIEGDPNDPNPSEQLIPGLPREALHRIARAEKLAKERYDEDKMPYFPTHPEFSFWEESIVRYFSQISDYLRIYTEEILDAHLRKYLEFIPSELITNGALLKSVGKTVLTLSDFLWKGYRTILQFEPSSRRARYGVAMAEGSMDQHPELEPWRIPDGQQWADFVWRAMAPESEITRLSVNHTRTIHNTVLSRVQSYQDQAKLKLEEAFEAGAKREEPNGRKDSSSGPSKQSAPKSGRRSPLSITVQTESRSRTTSSGDAEHWSVRLRNSREKLRITRPIAARRLTAQGAPITKDAIKKHEEGKAMPKKPVRLAYAAIYSTSEEELFS